MAGAKVVEINIDAALENTTYTDELRTKLLDDHILICRQYIDSKNVRNITEYLKQVGRNSLPTYEPIELGRPNFHRLNTEDERAIVKGCFHQFVFYPWNQDIFDLFGKTLKLFQLKNLLSRNESNRFIGRNGASGVVQRLAFQFYPSGRGFLNSHRDPKGEHQLTVPTLCCSKKGTDFQSGGLFVITRDGQRHELDSRLEIGDVSFFDADLIHGIDRIDPSATTDWLSFHGRWTLLIATNKVVGNTQIPDAIDEG